MDDLFQAETSSDFEPLASRLRPKSLQDYVGQSHLLAADKPLRKALEGGVLHSFILWGPPGTGKTSLARLFAEQNDIQFLPISAVTGGVADIRDAVQKANAARQARGQRSLVFVDEVHRFNKSQQDGFLPHIENGTFSFIGATTENPSFQLNSALLSRARVYRLTPLSEDELLILVQKALDVLGSDHQTHYSIAEDAASILLAHANGDARRLITMLEIVVQHKYSSLAAGQASDGVLFTLSRADILGILDENQKQFDKGGDHFYDQISALHKSVRGSDADAALYWFCRMVQSGCDPLYVGRRLVRMASEDIGNADPRALTLCLNACEAFERLGAPEGELALAQAVVYLAVSAKSNAVYTAFNRCMKLIKASPDYPVPMHLRNAPTQLMKEQGMGEGYRYAHDEQDAFAAGEVYLPEMLAGTAFYQPVDRGLETKIGEKMARLRDLNAQSTKKRYPT